MTQPQQPQAALDHARHDPALIAAYADRERDQVAADRSIAQERIAACEGCRDLLADLVILRDALPAARTPTRPRDFTLTAADARRLAPGGWRRAIGFFGSARDAFSRPLAIGFTTIGIVALLVTASPLSFGLMGQSAAAPALAPVGGAVGGAGDASAAPSGGASEPSREIAGAVASPAASAAPSIKASEAPVAAATDAGRAAYAPSASGGDSGAVFNGSNDTDNAYGDDGTDELQAASSPPTGPSLSGLPLGIVVSGVCLLIGIGLFVLRWSSRRLGGT